MCSRRVRYAIPGMAPIGFILGAHALADSHASPGVCSADLGAVDSGFVHCWLFLGAAWRLVEALLTCQFRPWSVGRTAFVSRSFGSSLRTCLSLPSTVLVFASCVLSCGSCDATL